MRSQGRFRRLSGSRQLATVFGLVVLCASSAAIAQMISELTGPVPPMRPIPAPPIPKWVTNDVRVMRAFPDQPPVIPHSIEGYQLTVNTNRCLSCHKREFTVGSGAPMISVTHYMTRDGQMLADVAPRRYFCTACHVPQADVVPLVKNTFRDMSELGFKPTGSE
ncbi:nitrate reductase cytochrome c-type subunit [Mesorhizobium sp. ANAO-SY3R2]|uniref:nitrate reductase cytochrome c-type subunit n=1 Tax=Mesorhizobium sp. ANAO-SY3R2 TaxID=3166644 RepID=UPI003672C15A